MKFFFFFFFFFGLLFFLLLRGPQSVSCVIVYILRGLDTMKEKTS